MAEEMAEEFEVRFLRSVKEIKNGYNLLAGQNDFLDNYQQYRSIHNKQHKLKIKKEGVKKVPKSGMSGAAALLSEGLSEEFPLDAVLVNIGGAVYRFEQYKGYKVWVPNEFKENPRPNGLPIVVASKSVY
jgi:hypothetical protein